MGLIKAITWRETGRGHQTLDMTHRSNVLAKDQYDYTQTNQIGLTSVAQQATVAKHALPSTQLKKKREEEKDGK